MSIYKLNGSIISSDSKFIKLFEYLHVNTNTSPLSVPHDHTDTRFPTIHYRLPYVLEYLNRYSKENYHSFKEFYGLYDDSIQDNQYSIDFSISFTYNPWNKSEACIRIVTYFESGDRFTNFEDHIQYLIKNYEECPSHYYSLELYNSIVKWKESLIESIK